MPPTWPAHRLLIPVSELLARHGPNGVARRNAAGALRVLALETEDRRVADAAVAQLGSARP